MTRQNLHRHWAGKANSLLAGRKIVQARYMTQAEQQANAWDTSGIVLELDNGLLVYPAADDEGNRPGALFTSDDKGPTLPVI